MNKRNALLKIGDTLRISIPSIQNVNLQYISTPVFSNIFNGIYKLV